MAVAVTFTQLPEVPAQFRTIRYAPVASTIPTTQGYSPRRTAWASGYLSSFRSRVMTSRMMTNDGSTTALVAISAPGSPACERPT